MDVPEELQFDRAGFSGVVRLFPLPNLVMFPHVLQPLHVFEPRYCDLLEEALAADRLIAMALLAPGWEQDYEGRPAIYPIACLGRVATCTRVEGGRYNLLLAGLARVGIVEELPATKTFRQARVTVCDDTYPADGAVERAVLRRQLRDAFRRVIPALGPDQQALSEVLKQDMDLGMLTDILGYSLELSLAARAALLGEPNVDRRAALLLDHLAAQRDALSGGSPATFPPDFSVN